MESVGLVGIQYSIKNRNAFCLNLKADLTEKGCHSLPGGGHECTPMLLTEPTHLPNAYQCFYLFIYFFTFTFLFLCK